MALKNGDCPKLEGDGYTWVRDISTQTFKKILRAWEQLSSSESAFAEGQARTCIPNGYARSLRNALFTSHTNFRVFDMTRDGDAYTISVLGNRASYLVKFTVAGEAFVSCIYPIAVY